MEIRMFNVEDKKATTGSIASQATLTEVLADAAAKYYNGEVTSMSDYEFDRMCHGLSLLETKNGFAYHNSPNVSVGSLAVSELEKSKHEVPALSLGKVKYANRKDLIAWLGGKEGIMSPKCDGCTVVITYKNGTLYKAVTRGNGEIGNVITHNAVHFKGIPTHIKYQGYLVIRGEATMSYEEFERINKEAGDIYENARNLASATIQMLDPNESKKREIVFHAFKLVSPGANEDLKTEAERFELIKSQGIGTVEYELVNQEDIMEKIEEWKRKVVELPFPTDGLVFSYNDQIYAEGLGNTEHHPRGSIAMKWTDETKETELTDVEWSVGKTGIITPVAIFQPVRLGIGSTVTRASMHNLSIMANIPSKENDGSVLQIGSKIHVGLANMIIPQVYLQESGDPVKMRPITIPNKCPICGTQTRIERRESVDVLHCDNVSCPARTRGMLVNACSKDGLNIKGLGPSQIEDLQQAKLIDIYPAEIFTLKKRTNGIIPKELEEKEGWGEKSWKNLLNAIDNSRKTTLQRFLFSLGIPLLGNDLSKKLSVYWGGDPKKFLEYYESPSYESLVELDGVGDVKACSVYDWCRFTKMDATKNLMLYILMEELEMEKPEQKSDQSLKGMTFVITGNVHIYKNRDEFKASVEARGGKVSGSVSSKTSYLINNDLESTSGKNKKAHELNIPILSEDAFVEKFSK